MEPGSISRALNKLLRVCQAGAAGAGTGMYHAYTPVPRAVHAHLTTARSVLSAALGVRREAVSEKFLPPALESRPRSTISGPHPLCRVFFRALCWQSSCTSANIADNFQANQTLKRSSL
ncbi:hypothetical protein XACS584_140038 [Xanthomonas citri pv. citri]|nr:hypothetical protein XACS584_140038 [Xanthomonas citri pv. citri]CEH62310.1 hypothetical protein XACS582_1600002 [Xanthomonas citri pv. citri]CEI01659.1 hypothetical protein XACG117_280031 [Xanthomonas citri pv. citri]CEI02086.1 hypothetical protein XACS581_310125 [Xanthomonas citri pv. citri]